MLFDPRETLAYFLQLVSIQLMRIATRHYVPILDMNLRVKIQSFHARKFDAFFLSFSHI